jgi:peptidoglycan/xylan/chitin deacetylase (PgdA/CDA1 family)
LTNPLTAIKNTWRKNWPEVHCGLTGGLPSFLLAKNPRPYDPGVPVFCYHVVSPDIFRDDLAFLKRNDYTTLTADPLLDHLEERTAAPPKSVVLTFDDGHANLYDTVFPLLREYRCRAVVFVVPSLHREENEPGYDASAGLCTWPQIQEMHASGLIDFQPHTNSHRYVPDWPRPLPLAGVDPELVEPRRPEPAALNDDLRLSKEELERRLGKTTQHLAFPQYNGTDEAIHIARDIGYRGFWWGVLPGRPLNRPAASCTRGDPANHIVRVSGEFVRRLPGEGRVTLSRLLQARYGKRFVTPGNPG